MADAGVITFAYDWIGDEVPSSVSVGFHTLTLDGKRIEVPSDAKVDFEAVFRDRVKPDVSDHELAAKRLAALLDRNNEALTRAALEEYAPGFRPPTLEKPTPTEVKQADPSVVAAIVSPTVIEGG